MYDLRSGYDVAIIGGGISGLSAAQILSRSNVRVCIFDDGSAVDTETHKFS